MEVIDNVHDMYLKNYDNTYKCVENKILNNLLDIKLQNQPHIIMYGPNGSFKNFNVYHLIKKITGYHNFNLKRKQEKINVNNNSVEFDVLQSENYIELNPSLNGFYDRWIITEYIQSIIEFKNILVSRHIVVIKDLDKLTHNAYMTLRRILEKYSINSLFIFTATNISSINEAILSRCLNIRCPLVSDKAIKQFLSLNINDKAILKNVASNCDRNIYKAILIHSQINNTAIAIKQNSADSDDDNEDNLKNEENEIKANAFRLILQEEIKEHYLFIKKTKDILKVAKSNRDFLHKILNFNYGYEDILMIFRDIFIKTFKKNNINKLYLAHDLLVKVDLELVKCQKDYFALEKFLLEVYKLIHFD